MGRAEHVVTMDDKGRVNFGSLVPPGQRGGTWKVTATGDGGFRVEPARVLTRTELYDLLIDTSLAANATTIRAGLMVGTEQLLPHLVTASFPGCSAS